MVDAIGQNNPYYVRQAHFADDRMAGSVPHWKNNGSHNRVESGTANSLAFSTQETQNIHAPSLSFGEVLDVVNPLHHLPVIGNVYRSLTGDEISPVARIAGGSLYGGPLGGLSSLAHAAIEEHSGQQTGQAIRSAATNDRPVYSIEDEPRTAGLLQKKADTNNDMHVEIAAATPNFTPISKPYSNGITEKIDWNAFENEKREPVTRVFIDMAEAPSPQKQQWNFNA